MPNEPSRGVAFFLTLVFAPSAYVADEERKSARRYTGNMNGERYLANQTPSKREVHDLDNEKLRRTSARPTRSFARVTIGYHSLDQARREGFDNRAWCIER